MGTHPFALLRRCASKTRRALVLVGSCAVAAPCLSGVSAAEENSGADNAPRGPVYSCRLLVLNGGLLGEDQLSAAETARLTAGLSNPFASERDELSRSHWVFGDKDAPQVAKSGGGLPVAGDFNGDGRAEAGIFRDGEWFVDLNGNGRWDDADLWAKLGRPGDQPLVGDWDGDGKADIGVYGVDTSSVSSGSNDAGLPDAENANSSNKEQDRSQSARPVALVQRGAESAVQASRVDNVLTFGDRPGIAVAGDFNGDGIDTIAIFRDGLWTIDVDGDGRNSAADEEVAFGTGNDWPVAGDFDGDGVDELGVYRRGKWLIRSLDGEKEVPAPALGNDSSSPVVGDFDGDGRDEAAVYLSE